MKHLKSLVAALALSTLAGTAGAAEPLVTTEWLEAELNNPQVRVVEVSVDPGVYERGHIPGAVNVSWHSDLVDTVTRDIVPREKFQALLSASGIDATTHVVLYGDNNNWFAAWGGWVFNYYGFENVSLLDGGRKKWEAEGRSLTTKVESYEPTQVTVGEPNKALRARLVDVLAVVEGGADVQIIDIRSPDEYQGKIFAPPNSAELAVRAGHVPGAVNLPWGKAVNEDGTYKSKDELVALYQSIGVDGSKPIIVYCRIGERSAHTWYALTQILGYEVRQYDGSWTEYGNAVGVPIVNLAGTVWGGK